MIELVESGILDPEGVTEAIAQPRNNTVPNAQSATPAPMPTDRRTIVEHLFPDVWWKDETTGYITCPGQDTHNGKNGPRDCRVKIDDVPTIYCVHESCEDGINVSNRALRRAIASSAPVVPTTEQKRRTAAAKAKAAREDSIKLRAKKSLPSVLKHYSWPYDQIGKDSSDQVGEDVRQTMFRAFMGMFESADIIWIGDVSDTGQHHHASHFKTKAEWLADEIPVGPLTCPSCFEPGTYSRSKDNVVVQRYLVVESDSLTKNEVGAIFRWLDEKVELPLRAVVDTAGKSLHGWFEFPPPDVLAELKIMLPAMACDSKMFGPSQPCRLPGGLRDEKIQKLIYSKNGGLL